MFLIYTAPILVVLVLLNLPFKKVMQKLAFPLAFLLLFRQIILVLVPGIANFMLEINPIPNWFNFNVLIDNLTLVLLLSIGVVGLTSLFIAWGSMKECKDKFNFVNLLLLSVLGMNGIVMVTDLFTLYVFLEITAVTSFILIAFNRGRDEIEGSFKYLVLSAIATVMLLSSIACLLFAAGSTSFDVVGAAIKQNANNTFLYFSMTLFIAGLFIKGGLIPFHGWLPDAYSAAPSSVSVLLAGIVTKTTGIYTLIRIVTMIFGFNTITSNFLLFVGTITLVIGALVALKQSDIKRMLAYSSISQVGYIVLGLGVGTELGIAGAVLHLFNHAIFKTQLFVNASGLENQTQSRNMDEMGGLSHKMPVTSFTTLIGFLSTSGVPPLGGFWSKLVIIVALWQRSHYNYAFIAVLASIITLAYFLSLERRVFFGKLMQNKFETLKEASFWFLVPSVVLVIITIGIGIMFPFMLETFLFPVKTFLW